MLVRDYLLLYINGQRHDVRGGRAFLSLSDYLRFEQGLTGTKIVCSEGDCGACSVLLGRVTNGRLDYQVVDACICFMYQLDGTHVISVEGLAPAGQLNSVQQAMIDHFGSQCGFCTPGFVVAMTACQLPCGSEAPASQGNGDRDGDGDGDGDGGEPAKVGCWQEEDQLRQSLTGNLCRCTGYIQILEAGLAVAQRSGSAFPDLPLHEQYDETSIVRDLMPIGDSSVIIRSDGVECARRVFVPSTFAEAVDIKGTHPDARIVNGATDVGVIYNKGRMNPTDFLSLSGMGDERKLEVDQNTLIVGAGCTWRQIEEWSRDALPELHQIIVRFGSPQIRNLSTLMGNIANASPIADSLPLLHVMEAELEVESSRGARRVNINDFYLGYKQLDLAPDEIIRRLHMPLPAENDVLRLYKISKRNDLDISTFTAAIRLTIEEETIQVARLAYGGVGPVVLRLPKTEAHLTGQPLTEDRMRAAGKIARGEITPISDVRGSDNYRFQLAENVLLKFYFQTMEEVGAQV